MLSTIQPIAFVENGGVRLSVNALSRSVVPEGAFMRSGDTEPRGGIRPRVKLLDPLIEIIYQLSISRETNMARFMISMPDEMLKKLDEAARKEHRSRSELLREAARSRLTAESAASPTSTAKRKKTPEIPKTAATGAARERLLRLGIGQPGCPGLDRLIGPDKARPEMRRLLKIGKKLTGLSREIIESRKDRW